MVMKFDLRLESASKPCVDFSCYMKVLNSKRT